MIIHINDNESFFMNIVYFIIFYALPNVEMTCILVSPINLQTLRY